MPRSKLTPRAQIVEDAITRFGHLPIKTIARYVLSKSGVYFDGDLESIRSMIRRRIGKCGERFRQQRAGRIMPHSGNKTLPPTWRQTRPVHKLKPGTWLVLQDLHVPFHEVKPIEAAFKYGQANKATGILLNGDIQDCASIGFWATMHRRDFMAEVEATTDFLHCLRQEFPKAEIVYKPGNHEYRLPRLYAASCPELIDSPLAAMETLLDFEGLGIEFLDYYQIVQAGLLPVLHGHEVNHIDRCVNPARGLFLRCKTWAACGHCHSTSEHTPRDLHGTLLTCWSFGCLCDLSPDYRPYANDWNWGFGLVNVEKNGNFEVENRRILSSGKVR